MNEIVEFGVRISKAKSSGYDVDIWHKRPDNVNPEDFAKINAGNIPLALKMALPYMVSVAQPDPFAELVTQAIQSNKEQTEDKDTTDPRVKQLLIRIEENVRRAANYLETESCYRIEYNRAWGQVPRVSYEEATSEADAQPFALPKNIRVLGLRRATLDDLEEFVQDDILS